MALMQSLFARRVKLKNEIASTKNEIAIALKLLLFLMIDYLYFGKVYEELSIQFQVN